MTDRDKTREELLAEVEELRRSEAKWRSIAENAPIFVSIVDQSGTMLFLNRYRPGFEPATVLGRSIYEFLQPPYHAVARNCLAHVFQTGERASYECVGAGADGALSAYLTDVGPVLVDGEIIAATLMARDMTDRARAQEALRNSERTLRTLIDANPESILLVETDGTILLANATAARRLGMSIDDLLGQKPHTLLPAHVADERLRRVKEVVASGKAVRFEDQRGDRYFEVAIHPILDDQGAVSKVAMLGIDRTDRKQAEEALQKSEELFRKVFEEGPLGVALIDLESRIQHVNSRLCQMLGYSEAEIIALGIAGITHPDDRPPGDFQRKQLLRGEHTSFTMEKRYIRKDGQWMWAHITTSMMHDVHGNPTNIIAMVENITDRKISEEESARRGSILQATIECLPFDFFALGDDGRYILQNAASKLHWDDAVGKRPEDVCPDARTLELWLDNNRRAFAGERIDDDVAFAVAGEQRFYRNTIAPIRDKDRIIGVLGMNVDITERKLAEAALQKAHDELEQRVRERTAELRYANASLQREVQERAEAQAALEASEEKYRQLVETTGTGYLILDGQGRVIDGNAEYVRISGHQNLQDILGRTVVEWTAPYDVDRNAIEVGKCMQRGAIRNLEVDYVHADGTVVPIEINATRLGKDNERRIVALCRDVSERRQAQRALRRSEERYDLAVRGAGVGIWDWDIRTNRLYYSPRWKQMLGLEEHELGDNFDDWRRLLHANDLDRVLKAQSDFLAGTEPTLAVEYRLRHKDGSYRWVATHCLAVRDDQGTALRLVGSNTDITDRKVAEMALQREHRTLEHMLKASDHERQLIAYEIHDGLAQYIAGAIMQLEHFYTIRDRADDSETAYRAGMELLRHSHFEARRLISGVRPPILDESGVMAAISHLIHDPAFAQGPTVELQSKVTFTRLPPVVENVIYRIVQEGLANARNHSKSERILVRLVQHQEHLRIHIRDWGIGFDPRKVNRNRFGLEGIRERARLLGGKCNIKSHSGAGSLIEVELPVAEEQRDR